MANITFITFDMIFTETGISSMDIFQSKILVELSRMLILIIVCSHFTHTPNLKFFVTFKLKRKRLR